MVRVQNPMPAFLNLSRKTKRCCDGGIVAMKVPRATMSSTPAGPATEKILVRGVNWLGDAVMTTPALQRLREAHPEAKITLLTHEKLADLWHNHPALDEVVTFG